MTIGNLYPEMEKLDRKRRDCEQLKQTIERFVRKIGTVDRTIDAYKDRHRQLEVERHSTHDEDVRTRLSAEMKATAVRLKDLQDKRAELDNERFGQFLNYQVQRCDVILTPLREAHR